jgi:hypothetical protein
MLMMAALDMLHKGLRKAVDQVKEGRQAVHLGIHRSDYMLHEETEARRLPLIIYTALTWYAAWRIKSLTIRRGWQAEKALPLFRAQAAGGEPKLFMQVGRCLATRSRAPASCLQPPLSSGKGAARWLIELSTGRVRVGLCSAR